MSYDLQVWSVRPADDPLMLPEPAKWSAHASVRRVLSSLLQRRAVLLVIVGADAFSATKISPYLLMSQCGNFRICFTHALSVLSL